MPLLTEGRVQAGMCPPPPSPLVRRSPIPHRTSPHTPKPRDVSPTPPPSLHLSRMREAPASTPPPPPPFNALRQSDMAHALSGFHWTWGPGESTSPSIGPVHVLVAAEPHVLIGDPWYQAPLHLHFVGRKGPMILSWPLLSICPVCWSRVPSHNRKTA